jgi:hypothetical protein
MSKDVYCLSKTSKSAALTLIYILTHNLEISMIHPPDTEILQTEWIIPRAHSAPFRQLTYIYDAAA